MRVSRSLRLAFFYRCLALVLIVACSPLQLRAQDSISSGQGSSLGMASPASGDSIAGSPMGGGAAMADFDTLMNLIQQTIEPDSWLINGGTNTILPYPSGVYVDPAGHVERVRESQMPALSLSDPAIGLSDAVDASSGLALRHPWRVASDLRVISLKKLDQALHASLTQGLNPSRELQQLAGLSKIRFVKIDAANEDILIAGPASTSVHGFEVQDVAVMAALVSNRTQPLGCSIDPSNEGIRAAQAMLNEDGVLHKLARNPRMVVEELQDRMGPHNVTVFGMPAQTGTAVALVDADEHMKKLGFGTAHTAVPLNSYFDHLDRQGGPPPTQSLIRWWFAFSDETIRVGPSGDLFELPENCVAVMSEQQWVTQQGRAPTGGNDIAADAFAEGMTERLADLRANHESYARLSAVFELSLALQLACERSGLPNLQAWLPSLCAIGENPGSEQPAPKTVGGLMTWHKLKSDGTIVAVVSGGVKIDALSIARKDRWESSKFLSSSVVPEPPTRLSSAHGQWWWELSP